MKAGWRGGAGRRGCLSRGAQHAGSQQVALYGAGTSANWAGGAYNAGAAGNLLPCSSVHPGQDDPSNYYKFCIDYYCIHVTYRRIMLRPLEICYAIGYIHPG